MNTFVKTVLLLVASAIILSSSQCNKPDDEPTIPHFSNIDPVVNPPDTFQLVFNISTFGDKYAYVTFKEDAVWLIENLGDSRVSFRIENDTDTRFIDNADTLGLKGGFKYSFVANNNNYTELTNLFTQFTKLNIDYESFEPKF
jgi:hypothetical protein